MKLQLSIIVSGLFALLLLTPLSSVAVGTTPQLGYITEVRGLKKVYRPGEKMVLTVRAKQADGRTAFQEQGWYVGVSLPEGKNDPLAPFQGASQSLDYKRGTWTFSYTIPATPDEYEMQLQLYCGGPTLVCGKYWEYEDTYYFTPLTFRVAGASTNVVSSERRPKTIRYSFPKRALRERSSTDLSRDDGLTEEELQTFLKMQKSPAPSIKRAWLTVDCSQDPKGTPESLCTSNRLWIDVRTAAGGLPVILSPSFLPKDMTMRFYSWFSASRRYGPPSQFGFAQKDGQWLATMHYGNFKNTEMREAIELEQDGKSAWYNLVLSWDAQGNASVQVESMVIGRSQVPLSSSRASQTSSSSSRSSVSSAPPASGQWKQYRSEDGLFSVSLPSHWVAISGYDGSHSTFSQITSQGGFYGDPQESQTVWIQVYSDRTAKRNGKTWSEFYVSSDRFKLSSTVTASQWIAYHFLLREGKTSVTPYQVLFDAGDTGILFSFGKKNADAERILSSFELLKQ